MDFFEGADDARCHLVDAGRIGARERIKRDGVIAVAGIEHDHVVRPFLRCERDDGFREVAVRIDQTDAVARAHVLGDHVLDQGRLAHAGLAHDVEAAAVFERQADGSSVVAESDVPEYGAPLFLTRGERNRSFEFAEIAGAHFLRADGGCQSVASSSCESKNRGWLRGRRSPLLGFDARNVASLERVNAPKAPAMAVSRSAASRLLSSEAHAIRRMRTSNRCRPICRKPTGGLLRVRAGGSSRCRVPRDSSSRFSA